MIETVSGVGTGTKGASPYYHYVVLLQFSLPSSAVLEGLLPNIRVTLP